MFREEISGYSGPPRRQSKTPWVFIVCVIVAGLVVAHMAGLTKPFRTMAVQLGQDGSRDLRTPASRLIGDWESDDDPMFRRVCHMVPKDPSVGTGIYRVSNGSRTSDAIYKIVSEDRSGTNLVMAEFLPVGDRNYRVRYSIAKDGQSMTREYEDHNGRHVSCQYRYLGPPTQSLP